MNYDRKTLRATALSVKADWTQHAKNDHAKKTAAYKRDLDKWEAAGKAETLAALAEAIKRTKANKPVSGYDLRNKIDSAPTPPGDCDCCTPVTQSLDSLVALLDTIKDDGVSSSALSQAGFKDLSRLLRRPC